jgi:nucleoside-diphosphate-sugar epimerase
VLVTGGCGFIGTHVVRHLASAGYQVTVFDDLSNGDQGRIAPEVSRGVRVIVGDVTDRAAVASAMGIARPWGVIHLAAPVSVAESKQNPDKYFRAIVDGMYQVVTEARSCGVSRIVNLNSAAVYGRASIVPTPETYPASPTNPYGVAKHVAEQLILHTCRMYGIGCVSLRLTNLYGEYASALFGLFVRQMRAGEPLTVTGDGSQRRDFTYVGDVAITIEAALSSDLDFEILNVGTGETISVLEMAQLFGAPITFIPRAADEPDVIQGSVDRLGALLPGAVPRARPQERIPEVLGRICKKPSSHDAEDQRVSWKVRE